MKIGSEVQYILLEIIPRLNKGVIIHFYNILHPSEYHKHCFLQKHIFWNEMYLLQTFLAFTNSFEVFWVGSYMHLKHPYKLETYFILMKEKKEHQVVFG